MHKIFLTVLLSAFFVRVSLAQSYQFSMSNAAYTELVSPTVISTAGWDEELFHVALPFSFSIYGVSVDSIDIYDGTVFSAAGYIDPFFADLKDNSSSVISYRTEGNSPNRIFKIEWKNAGFEVGQGTDFANFQLWLYEGSNRTEMRYSAITANATSFGMKTGAGVGISNFSEIRSTYLTGNPGSPTVSFDPSSYVTLAGAPSSGTVYTFNYGFGLGAPEILAARSKAGPNPFDAEITVKIKDPEALTIITLYDVQGKVLQQENVQAQSDYVMNTAGVPAGIYVLVVCNGNETWSSKLCKN